MEQAFHSKRPTNKQSTDLNCISKPRSHFLQSKRTVQVEEPSITGDGSSRASLVSSKWRPGVNQTLGGDSFQQPVDLKYSTQKNCLHWRLKRVHDGRHLEGKGEEGEDLGEEGVRKNETDTFSRYSKQFSYLPEEKTSMWVVPYWARKGSKPTFTGMWTCSGTVMSRAVMADKILSVSPRDITKLSRHEAATLLRERETASLLAVTGWETISSSRSNRHADRKRDRKRRERLNRHKSKGQPPIKSLTIWGAKAVLYYKVISQS